MNYLTALTKSTCEVTNPIKNAEVSKPTFTEKCMNCSVAVKNKGVCKSCSKLSIAYGKCVSCTLVKLTCCGLCKQCFNYCEEDEEEKGESDYDPNECRICGDTDNINGSCLTCIRADARDERNGRY